MNRYYSGTDGPKETKLSRNEAQNDIGFTDKINPIHKTNVHEMILEQLEKLILSGDLKPGEKLPGERSLSEKFGASRNSVRVALKLLEFMNLLEVRPGSGVYVASSPNVRQAAIKSHWTELVKQHPLIDLIEARQSLEPAVAGLAAQNATEEEIIKMDAELSSNEEELSKKGLAAKHASRFHELLFGSTHNIILEHIGAMLQSLAAESKKVSLSSNKNIRQSLTEHREILEAVKNRDSELAAHRMKEHLTGVQRHLREAGLEE